MVEHIVLFKLKAEVTAEEKQRAKDEIYALYSSIPGITRITYGEDHILTRGKGFTHALITRHTSKETAVAYQAHPEHIRVRDHILIPLIERDNSGAPIVLSVDFLAHVIESWRLKELIFGALAGSAISFLFLFRNRYLLR